MTLLERIIKQNPWWESKEIDEIKNYRERFLLKEILGYKKDPQMIAVLGLRRTGKTVLLFQLIKRFIKEIPSKRILYFSFDEILGKDPKIIERILEIYENEILKGTLKNVFIFFDEINHLENWQVVLKRYYELKKKIKFFVSGSSSIFLKKTKESLAGRIYEFELKPLTFKEFLFLKGIEIKDINIQRLILKKELNKYFLSGSLPEIMQESDFLKVKKYINSIIDKIIFYDIPKVYEVAEPEVLKAILTLIAQKPGMILKYQSLSSAFGVTYQTISKYINYLEKSFLIKLIYNFRGSPIARARKLKKVYLGCLNIAEGFSYSENELLKSLPYLAENLVCLHLDSKWFWRKYSEVDFYHQNTPIEVKYTQAKPDIKNSLLAAKTLGSKKMYVITKDIEHKEKIHGIEVTYTPLWKFLVSSDK
mgnify:CR=1 FL=1